MNENETTRMVRAIVEKDYNALVAALEKYTQFDVYGQAKELSESLVRPEFGITFDNLHAAITELKTRNVCLETSRIGDVLSAIMVHKALPKETYQSIMPYVLDNGLSCPILDTMYFTTIVKYDITKSVQIGNLVYSNNHLTDSEFVSVPLVHRYANLDILLKLVKEAWRTTQHVSSGLQELFANTNSHAQYLAIFKATSRKARMRPLREDEYDGLLTYMKVTA